MGYTLMIGEAKLDYDEDMVRVGCIGAVDTSSPAFGEPTDGTNSRWPSYSGWANFCRDIGIEDLMGLTKLHEVNGIPTLIQSHPGATPIRREHLEAVQQALQRYREAHPHHIAQYPPLKEGVEDYRGLHPSTDYVDDPKYDGNLCRGEWLVFWLSWALDNCEKPIFYNS